MKPANAVCSFCGKQPAEVGPLVEGLKSSFICGGCVELSASIIELEKRRRGAAPHWSVIKHEDVRKLLDAVVNDQQEAKAALDVAVAQRLACKGAGHVLLVGPSPSSKVALAGALAHALDVPFAATDAAGVQWTKHDGNAVLPVLLQLAASVAFDFERAQHGVVYLDGVEKAATQDALLQLWGQNACQSLGQSFEPRRLQFICGANIAALEAAEQPPLTFEMLVAAGLKRELVGKLSATARVTPLDEDTLTCLLQWVDFKKAREPANG